MNHARLGPSLDIRKPRFGVRIAHAITVVFFCCANSWADAASSACDVVSVKERSVLSAGVRSVGELVADMCPELGEFSSENTVYQCADEIVDSGSYKHIDEGVFAILHKYYGRFPIRQVVYSLAHAARLGKDASDFQFWIYWQFVSDVSWSLGKEVDNDATLQPFCAAECSDTQQSDSQAAFFHKIGVHYVAIWRARYCLDNDRWYLESATRKPTWAPWLTDDIVKKASRRVVP